MATSTPAVKMPASADAALSAFHWTPQPEAEEVVRALLDEFLPRSPLARTLRDRMYAEAGVRFADMVDHIVLADSASLRSRLLSGGFAERGRIDGTSNGEGYGFVHPGGLFPAIVPDRDPAVKEKLQVSLRVESIAEFVSVWQTPAVFLDIHPPGAKVRLARVEQNASAALWVVERHGAPGFNWAKRNDVAPANWSLQHGEALRMRPRVGDDDEALFASAAGLLDNAIAASDADFTADLFFAIERDYWQRRNRAAQAQRARQDRLGIGWANHDHHTYRSSRRHFARLISIFEKLGFHCRERFYAGKEAGWGAQVLEQSNAGIVIFADVDLSPDELRIDFAHQPLPERDRLGTVGLWCALHGESFLESGMHHLECQFDFDALKHQLEVDAGIRTMKPFTNFPYLRQAFTEGERWPVREERIERLLARGQISAAQAEHFRAEGAIGSHLENLERNQGFKGFNQQGVSEIIAATDPRRA